MYLHHSGIEAPVGTDNDTKDIWLRVNQPLYENKSRSYLTSFVSLNDFVRRDIVYGLGSSDHGVLHSLEDSVNQRTTVWVFHHDRIVLQAALLITMSSLCLLCSFCIPVQILLYKEIEPLHLVYIDFPASALSACRSRRRRTTTYDTAPSCSAEKSLLCYFNFVILSPVNLSWS